MAGILDRHPYQARPAHELKELKELKELNELCELCELKELKELNICPSGEFSTVMSRLEP